jgi:hypothetical protein
MLFWTTVQIVSVALIVSLKLQKFLHLNLCTYLLQTYTGRELIMDFEA